MKGELAQKRLSVQDKKQRKALSTASDVASSEATAGSPSIKSLTSPKQQSITASLCALSSNSVDDAIAPFFNGDNISFRTVESPHFHVVTVLRMAPATYKALNRRRLAGNFLDATCASLRAADQPIRENVLGAHGCTLLCDGWDNVECNHLVNLLFATTGASFFKGTTKLDIRCKFYD